MSKKKPVGKDTIYVNSKADPRYKAYMDSLEVYNSYKDVERALLNSGYEPERHNLPSANRKKYIRSTKDIEKWDSKGIPLIKGTKLGNKILENYEDLSPDLKHRLDSTRYEVLDLQPAIYNTNLPYQLFNSKIKPVAVNQYEDTNKQYPFLFDEGYHLDGPYAYAESIPSTVLSGGITDIRSVFNYSNANPTQVVKVKDEPQYKKTKTKIRMPERLKKMKSKGISSPTVNSTTLSKTRPRRPSKHYAVRNRSIPGVPENFNLYWPDGTLEFNGVSPTGFDRKKYSILNFNPK